MKRTTLLPLLLPAGLILFVLLLATVWGQFSGPVNVQAPPDPAPEFVVLAWDSPGWMKPGGNGRFVCDATAARDDGIEIQAAIDAAAMTAGAQGGYATVRLGPTHTYYQLKLQAGQTAVSGTADLTKPSAAGVLATITFAEGTIADVAEGQVYRVSVNTGTNPATNEDDILYTVVSTTAGPDTITFWEIPTTTYTGANNITFTRVRTCLNLKGGVRLVGSCGAGTKLRLYDGQNCTMLMAAPSLTDPGSAYYSVENIWLYGNNANQTSALCSHGLVLNRNVKEFNFRDGGVTYVKGTCAWALGGWGVVIDGNAVFEPVGGEHGLAVGYCNGLVVDGLRIVTAAGDRHGVLLHNTGYASFRMGYMNLSGSGKCGFYFAGNPSHDTISGVPILLDAASGASKAFRLDGSYHTITGNTVRQNGAGSIGVDFTGGPQECTITANAFYPAGAGAKALNIPTTTLLPGSNQVVGNTGVAHGEEIRCERMTNANAGTIAALSLVIRDTTAGGSYAKFNTTNAVGSRLAVGVLLVQTATTASGPVQVQGYSRYFPVTDADIAVGDYICTSATPGSGQKAVATDWAIAVCDEVKTKGDGKTYIDAVILPEPVYVP